MVLLPEASTVRPLNRATDNQANMARLRGNTHLRVSSMVRLRASTHLKASSTVHLHKAMDRLKVARLVDTPDSNSMAHLQAAGTKAVGMGYGFLRIDK